MSERGWQAVFDWIISSANSQAILEGKYDTWQKTDACSTRGIDKQDYDFPRMESAAQPAQVHEQQRTEEKDQLYPDMPSVSGTDPIGFCGNKIFIYKKGSNVFLGVRILCFYNLNARPMR